MFLRFPKDRTVSSDDNKSLGEILSSIEEVMIKEREPVSSSEVYRNLQENLRNLVENISSVILERITTNLDLDNDMTVTSLFKELGIYKNSFEYNLFYSSYQQEIFEGVESELWKRGYVTKITTENDRYGYTNKIFYETRVINTGFASFRRALVMISMSILVTYGVPMMYQMTKRYVDQYQHGEKLEI